MDARKIYELRTVDKIRADGRSLTEDPVVSEIPLTVMLNDQELATLVCSPIFEKELVVGFLAGEGLIRDPDDISDYSYREQQGVVWVETKIETPNIDHFLRRNFASCCGKGRPSLYYINDTNQINPITSSVTFSTAQVLDLVRHLDEESGTFQLTGGVHTAAIADQDHILMRYEDIGRHNALDRVMGHVFLNRISTEDKAVILSGRIASEMLIKAARIGTPVIISRSAPTGLAIDLAEQLGLTMIGFARGTSLNIYCHKERIIE